MIITPLFIFLIFLVFIPTFLFIRTIDNRKWLTLLISIIITPIIYFYVFYPMLNIFSSYHHEKYFNQRTWHEYPELRYEMRNDMINSKQFIGKSKNEISNALGEYEWLSWDYKLNQADDNIWNYSIGMKPGAFNENKEIISLKFENGKLKEITTQTEKIQYDSKN